MALLPPGIGSGESLDHGDLTGRDAANSHPISAITGLTDWLGTLTAADEATAPIRVQYNWTSQSVQDISLPEPYDTLSAVIAVIRLADGRLIEPDVQYTYAAAGLPYIQSIRLTFSPPISGTYVVHVVR